MSAYFGVASRRPRRASGASIATTASVLLSASLLLQLAAAAPGPARRELLRHRVHHPHPVSPWLSDELESITAMDAQPGKRLPKLEVGQPAGASWRGRLAQLPTACDFSPAAPRETPPDAHHKYPDLYEHGDFFDGYAEVSLQDASRYEIGAVLGHGGGGVVVAALDTATGEQVAIKKITGFLGAEDAQAVLKEVLVMQRMSGAEGVLQLRQVLPSSSVPVGASSGENSSGGLSALYLVIEKMDASLEDVLGSTKDMELPQQKWLIFQMVQQLAAVHKAGVVHNDVRTKNMLIRGDCQIKLSDFGSSKLLWEEPKFPYSATDHVGIPLRRPTVASPEVDVWWMGLCILAVASGEGVDSHADRDTWVHAWYTEYGEPPAEMLAVFKPKVLDALDEARKQPSHSFQSLWPDVNRDVMRLVKRMMGWDLRRIPTAAELLVDPLFDEVYHMMGPALVPQGDALAAAMSDSDVRKMDGAAFLAAIHGAAPSRQG